MNIFEQVESQVRVYCRSFPVTFVSASGSRIVDQSGREYIDLFSGAGALNYGHNNPRLKRRLLDYLASDGITHSLDMSTAAKAEFLERFQEVILSPRGLDYKVQFTGPTGTNAVEAALKLARKVTGRQTVVYFYNAFHGMTLGAMSVMGNAAKRASMGIPIGGTLPMPFDGDLGPGQDTLAVLQGLIENGGGIGKPAAVIVETIQCEGGIRVAGFEWLGRLARLLRKHEIPLIVDDIQTGCGRTGPFFSFEPAGIRPDLVCLSKSISGFGLPMSLVLIRPDLDIWKPGEHNGTFRGNNLAFVAGAEALGYWEDGRLSEQVRQQGSFVQQRLKSMMRRYLSLIREVRGRGLVQGIVFHQPGLAVEISRAAFERGLIIETAGPRDEVLKLLPPLLIEAADLERSLAIIEESLEEVLPTAPIVVEAPAWSAMERMS